MKSGEKPGGSAEDEQVLTGYEDGIPPFGGEDTNIDVPLDSDAELSDDGAIDDSEIQQMLEHDDPVQFEDSDASIDVSVNESEGSKPEISKEDFELALDKLRLAYKRWSDAYNGDFDPTITDFSHSLAYRKELDKRLGRDGWLYSSFLYTSYKDFIDKGHTLEEISEEEKKFAEMADAIEAIDMSDFVEPSDEAGEPSDGEKQEELKEAFDIAISRFESAYYGDNLSPEESAKRILKIDSLMDDRGEKAALQDVEDYLVARPSEITQDVIDEVNRVAEIIEELNLDDELGAGGENNPDLEEDDENRTELLKDFEDSANEFISATIRTGLWVTNLEPVYAELRKIGEEDTFKAAFNSWVNIRRNPDSAKTEDIYAVKAELDRLTEVLKNLKADASGEGGDDGGENAEDQEKKTEAIDKLINTRDMKRISLLLEKIGLDNTHSLDEAEPILNSLNLAELERIQKEIDDEINGEGDKDHEANGENLEYLRSLNFGQWLAVKYDVPGPDSKYFNPNFFAADRKLQQQVMQEYMALFEADANYEKDRAFMVEELCRVEFAKKTMEEMGLDPAETNLGDLEPMLNKMKIEELNKLYRKVFYSPKPAPKPTNPKPSSKPTDPKPAEPKPADAEPGNDGSDDGSDDPDANPSVNSSEGDDSSEDGDANVDKDMTEKIKGIDKKMPATAEDVKAVFAASPDARRIYGEPDDETVSKTLEEIKVWKKLSDAQKADFLQNGIVLAGIDLNDQIALMELQKKGILPKHGV